LADKIFPIAFQMFDDTVEKLRLGQEDQHQQAAALQRWQQHGGSGSTSTGLGVYAQVVVRGVRNVVQEVPRSTTRSGVVPPPNNNTDFFPFPSSPSSSSVVPFLSFEWGDMERTAFTSYQTRLTVVVVVAFLVVCVSMVCILPQFFTTGGDGSGGGGGSGQKSKRRRRRRRSDGGGAGVGQQQSQPPLVVPAQTPYCVRCPLLSYTLAGVLFALTGLMGVLLLYENLVNESDARRFYTLFRDCEKEERFLSQLEHTLNCLSDDDIEGVSSSECDNIIDRAMLGGDRWAHPLWLLFCVLHVFQLVALMALNRKDLSQHIPFFPVLRDRHRHRHESDSESEK